MNGKFIGTTMPTVDPEQQNEENCKKGTPKSVLGIGAFSERASCNRSHYIYNSYRQVGYVKLRGGRWFNGRRKSNHFNMN